MGLDEVSRHNHKGIAVEDGFIHPQPAFQASRGAGQDQCRLDMELVVKLCLPLFSKLGWTQDTYLLDLPSVQHFAGNQACLDGLTYTHVVRNQ